MHQYKLGSEAAETQIASTLTSVEQSLLDINDSKLC